MNKLNERRKTSRGSSFIGDAFVEITHSFGAQKKSVYSIHAYDEFGLSILIPERDGYFLQDKPLQLIIVHISLKFRRIISKFW